MPCMNHFLKSLTYLLLAPNSSFNLVYILFFKFFLFFNNLFLGVFVEIFIAIFILHPILKRILQLIFRAHTPLQKHVNTIKAVKAKVALFLDDFGKAFDDDVKVFFGACDVSLLDDYVILQIHLHIHIIRKKLHLRIFILTDK